ncbi:methyltransferase domain-containing protein [Chryseosolibacter indicus]|uniref:Methyltransferase domain-containing protein n=1 Tax=Chryseosolibacter indicus TaxID=2782351 RepID=A0ABS5VW51_9BACT|nr:methyltransferase domain-containing protein [Chryseosolibacter indicus]MBT1704221.1 methyltransferase domain-containing protein [Chryseosolibacter indicus]
MPDFSQRSYEEEIMDDLGASGAIIDVTLKELETINLLLGGNYVTVNGVNTLIKNIDRTRKLSIVDLGCGSGDILRLIRKSLNKRQINADLIGVDANPNIIAYAKKHNAKESGIHFEALNIFSEEFKTRQFDIVTATLFFHHFTNDQLISFFAQLKNQVRIGIVINDIHRHWFAYYSIKWLTKLFSKSTMVINDAPLSVMRAFKKVELENILQNAGIKNYKIKWMWAFRWQIIISI